MFFKRKQRSHYVMSLSPVFTENGPHIYMVAYSSERGGSGDPGLVDRVLALHAGSRGFDSHRGHMSERFFRSNRPGYPHPVSSELEKVVSEWRSVIAVSLNVGGGVRLIKPAKLYIRKTLQTQRGRTHGAGCVRQWFRTAEPLGERRYEN